MTGARTQNRAATRDIGTSAVCWRLLRNEPAAYAIGWIQWVGFFSSPLLVGWLVKQVIDRLDSGAESIPWMLLCGVGAVEVARWLLLVSAAVQWHGMWVGWQTLPRVNLFRSLVSGRGPVAGRLPGSPGEAVSRFRDDVQDVAMVLDVSLDVSGAIISSIIAVTVMAAISPWAAVAVVVPVALAVAIAAALGPKLKEWREAERSATASVTGFIGDTFGAILAVKTAGAEDAASARFRALNHARAQVALRDTVGSEFVRSLGLGTGEIAVGVVLVVVSAAATSGELSPGDLALFVGYVGTIATLARWAGRVSTYVRQAGVSVSRLAELSPDHTRPPMVEPAATHLRHGPPPLANHRSADPSSDEAGLVSLAAHDLKPAISGARPVSFEIAAGELVVVTGAVGSGKSTLLRALLGLVDSSGTVTWNGEAIEPAEFLVPPRAAYLPQVPRLFSESLADTVLLGLAIDDLEAALWTACMESDVATMDHGPDTLVGPRGMRLSGGQVQRTAAARALVRKPDLLVVDDMSSALDIETEMMLWERLRSTYRPATLMVSHRPAVVSMADRVIELGQ